MSMARARSMPAVLALPAKSVLGCERESNNRRVAKQLHMHHATVGKWRRRFIEGRITGMRDELRPGKPGERALSLRVTTL